MITGGIRTKIEEATKIAVLGADVVIALAGSEAGRLACRLDPKELKCIEEWQGTCVWRTGA